MDDFENQVASQIEAGLEEHKALLMEQAEQERTETLKPLVRSERLIRRVSVFLAIFVVLAMSVIGGIAYTTSRDVLKLQNKQADVQKQIVDNSEVNKEALSIIKSCIVPEDPGTCNEEQAAATAAVVAQIVCLNYQYDRAFIESVLTRIGPPVPVYPNPPEGCTPLPTPTLQP